MTKSKIKKTYVPKLFDKPSYLTKITLKNPYLEAIALRFILFGTPGKSRIAPQFPRNSFFKDDVLIKPDHSYHANQYLHIYLNKSK